MSDYLSDGQQSAKTENKVLELPTEYSSIPAQSSSANDVKPTEGNSPQQIEENRSQYIPRDRFDQVLQERNASQQALQMLQQQMLQTYQQQQVGNQITGMQPAQPQQPQINFEEWQEKIANQGAAALYEFMQAAGQPLIQQEINRVMQQITPIQQTITQQVVDNYAASRSSDPSFATIRPLFNNYVQAIRQQNPGQQFTPDSLQFIEYAAKQQAEKQGLLQHMQAPFSERPGASFTGKTETKPTITAEQQRIARVYGMSDEEYMRNYQ